MKDSSAMSWSSASQTHVGKVRLLNEDACLELADSGLWAVADGMGGHSAGDLASRSIVEALSDISRSGNLDRSLDEVAQCLQKVNSELIEEARRSRVEVIGSTVVVLLVHATHGAVLWAGDSRAYRYRDGVLQQLTRDHSQVEELVAQGRITRDQAEYFPGANVITRAVGVTEPLELESVTFEIAVGDRFLLCCDGLYNEVEVNRITESLSAGDSQRSCELLMESALSGEAQDNISVVVVRAMSQA
jgi:protein phosphatase